jgi:hypothetical protein
MKETLIHDTRHGNINGPVAPIQFNPDENLKTTLRETLLHESDYLNLKAVGAGKGTTFDPNGANRMTHRETMCEDNHAGIAAGPSDGGYKTSSYHMGNTDREMNSTDYTGNAAKDYAGGYKTAAYHVDNTQKQFTSDVEHYGAAASSNKKQVMKPSNVAVNPVKELLYNLRVPAGEGEKTTVSGKDIHFASSRQNLADLQYHSNVQRGTEEPVREFQFTKQKKQYPTNDLFGGVRGVPEREAILAGFDRQPGLI